MTTFADKVIDFNRNLHYAGKLPDGFRVLNPYLDNPETMQVMGQFYHKYYNDNRKRKFIIGINPSRHGAGVTGVPFTDTKRLEAVCGIKMQSAYTHEVSSVFMYDMIAAWGGARSFYKNFYINSPFPLAIIRQANEGKWLNANYYDDPKLFERVRPFMIDSLKKHISLGLDTSEVFILGKKNATFINKLNATAGLFDKATVLEHPRYIEQYKSKEKQLYIDKYILELGKGI
ncbi:MAG: SMUG2 DNA glycosylase family protein [Niabella sp.]|nr:SMUG2 DNA glycosylase family protein [Niabella sp.]